MKRFPILIAVLIVGVLAVSCGSTPSEPLTTDDLSRTCRDLRFEGAADEELPLVPIPEDVEQILSAEIDRIGADAVATDVVQWFLVSRTEDEIAIAHKRSNGDADSYTQGHLRRTDDGWRGGSWGPCEVRFAAQDRALLRWGLDDGASVGADSSVISVVAGEIYCAASPDLQVEEIEPVVIATDARVTVVLTAPLSEDPNETSCRRGNPYFLELDLGEPLGDRSLHDGADPVVGSQRHPVAPSS